MQYMGSKNRLSKDLLPIILAGRTDDQFFVEPFAGGCNMIDKVTGNRIANDNHYYLIRMFQELQNGWIPPVNVSKEEYYDIKENQESMNPALVGFVGFLCSFGGKWWGGYAANSKGDNYAERGSRILVKQIQQLQNVRFTNIHYQYMTIPNSSIIYCDPPYEGTTGYASKFDHVLFWNWVREQKTKGHSIFVSEYNAPADFTEVYQKTITTTLDKNSQYPRIEKLFTLK